MSVETVITGLRSLLGDRLATSNAVRDHHSHDSSWHPAALPDAVAFPRTEAEVQAIVRLCAEHDVAVIPFGAGSSMEGHTIPTRGGITIDMRDMNKVLEIRPEDGLAVVQAGVTRKQLNTELRATGLMFSVDPGADASLGGMASTRGSGTMAYRYGTMRDNVLALRVVTADGQVVRTGSRARKSSTGYDLTHLFVGAEGTLGVITELTVRLHPIPEAVSSAICAFPDAQSAVACVIEAVQYGLPMARVEFLDEVAVSNVNSYSGLTLRVAPTLLFEFHGTEAWAAEQAQIVESLAEGHGGADFVWTADAEERGRLWQARHDLYWATKARRPGCELYTGDICVPISELAGQIEAARADIEASFLEGQIIGHVGDGNYHAGYLVMRDSPEEMAEAARLAERLVERALQVGGTASGEHGIGLAKLKYLRAEHGDAAVELMKTLKRAMDPKGILNPGKLGQAG
ncbi:FAD-binding oxidoreductase [Pararhodobacter aggregans]|uniref:D-lactate dehydrogenase (cytochrome) n=1 Tax=Pararhodobacter aggregans TaxID=404875 RepID=A0A2T7UUP4_9RHOB|nr:FAD-linked oxidase C-terminal domain-containing protein [Pararhodobacter aggregans]PTX04238.1 D-lactate dehydrogenase (cytochrome) [Pararhodobacter aggregans]PVE48316.1 FAD-binding oxidoreductase [Pararhodobacter aggregans]